MEIAVSLPTTPGVMYKNKIRGFTIKEEEDENEK